MVKVMASVRNVFRSNKAGQESLPSEVVDIRDKLQEEDRIGTEATLTDDSSGGSGHETQSAGSTENSIHNHGIQETAESLGAAQNKSNSNSGITSKPIVESGEAFLSVIDDDDRSLPLVDLENSTSSFDRGYYQNSTLSLTKSPKQVPTTTNISSAKHKRVSSGPTADDDDNNCLPLGASHNLLDSSIPNNSQDELFEQLYEMDLNDDEEFGALYFSNDIPSHSGKEGSKRKSRKGVADMEASVLSTRTGDEKKEGSKRKSKKEGSKKKSSKSLIDTTEDSKHKSLSSLSKSRGRSKSKPRKAEKEGSKRKSRSLHVRRESTNHGEGDASLVSPTSRPDGDIADNNFDDSMLSMGNALCKSPFDTRPTLNPGGTRNRSLGTSLPSIFNPPVYSPDGIVNGDDNSKSQAFRVEKPRKSRGRSKSTHKRKGVVDGDDDSKSQAFQVEKPRKTRGRSKSTHKRKGVVDGDDDSQSQASQVEKPRKSRDRSKSTHKRKSSKPLVEGLHQEVEQLKKELSEAWLIADDFAMNQKERQFIFELTKKELDLLKLEQLDAEEAKQEHERVKDLLPAAIRDAEVHKEALEAERVKLSNVSVAYARLISEHHKAKEAAEEVEQLREQLSISKRESEERAVTQKQERSAFAALVTELTQLKIENEKVEAVTASEEVDKLRDQLSEALKKVEEIEEARKEDKMMLAKSTRELAEFQMDQETSISNINHYAEIVRVNDVRISSLEAGLKNKDLIILEAKGIVEALDSALEAANQRNVSQGFDDFQENCSADSSMKESNLQESSTPPASLRGEPNIFDSQREDNSVRKERIRLLESASSSESSESSGLQRETDLALKERLRRLESASSSERQKTQIEITGYKQQAKAAKRANDDAQEQIKLLEALVDNLKVSSSSQGQYGSDVAAVRAELDEAHAQLKLFGKQIQSLRAMNENLEDNGREELARRALVEARLDELENDRISISASLSEERTVNERRASELKDTRRHIMVLEDEIDAFHIAEDQQYEETGRAKHENERTKEEVDRLKRDHEKELESAQRSLETALRRVEILEAEIQNKEVEQLLIKKIEEAQRTITELEERQSQEKSIYQEELTRLEEGGSISSSLNQQLAESKEQIEVLRETLSKSQIREADLSKEIEEARIAARDLEDGLRRDTVQTKKELAELSNSSKASILSLTNELSDVQKQLSEHTATAEDATSRVKTLELEIAVVSSTKEQIEQQLEEETAKYKAKMVQLETNLEAREHALAGEIEILKHKANTLADDLDQANLKKTALELELYELASRDKEQKNNLTDDFQSQIEGLKIDFNTREASLKKGVSESNAETSAAKELLKEAQLDVRRLEEEAKTAQESLGQLDDSRDSETKALQTRLSALQHDHEATKRALDQELEVLKSTSKIAGVDLDCAESKIRVLQEVVDEWEVAHDEVNALALQLQDEVSKWKAEASEWKEKSDNWKGKSVEWEKRATQLAGGSDTEVPQASFLQTAVDRKKSPAETADSQGWGRLGSIFKKGPTEESSNTQIQDLLEKNASLEAKLAELSTELVEMRSAHQGDLCEFVKKIEKLESENADYSLRLDAL